MAAATVERQWAEALQKANTKRTARADLRARLMAERGALEEVVMAPPVELADMFLVDVVRLAYHRRATKALQRLGRLAVRDNINLLVPLGAASVRSREWVATHATWGWMEAAGARKRYLRVHDDEAA